MSSSGSTSLYRPEFEESWKEHSLINLADWINGKAFSSDDFSEIGTPIIKISEIKDGVGSQTKHTEGSYKDKYKISEGDLLFAWSGSPDTSIDAHWWDGPEGWLNQHIFKVKSNDNCRQDFLFYLLKYIKPNLVEIARNNQTTGLGHVRKKDLEQLSVRVPNKSEQQDIISLLHPLDEKYRINNQITQSLQQVADSIFKNWFVEFDRYSEFRDTNLGQIPADFEVGTLSDIAEVKMGNSPKSEFYNEDEDGLPFFQGKKNFGEIYPSIERWCSKPKKIGNVDDIMMTVRAPVGDLNRLHKKSCIGRGVAAFSSLEFDSNDFIYYLLREKKGEWKKYSSGTTYQSVNTTDVEDFPIVSPPKSERKRFIEIVDPLTKIIKNNYIENQNLRNLRNTLLPKLMTGEIMIENISPKKTLEDSKV